MDAIDRSARAAAWQAVADAQQILDRLPNLSIAERGAVIGGKLTQANKDWMGNYIPAEAAAAFRRAVDEVCTKLLSAASGRSASAVPDEHDESFGLGPRQAAELLHRRRTGR